MTTEIISFSIPVEGGKGLSIQPDMKCFWLSQGYMYVSSVQTCSQMCRLTQAHPSQSLPLSNQADPWHEAV